MGGLLAILIENWVVISLIGSVVFIIIGWIFFGISPFLPFKERRRRQEVEDFRNSVVAQHLELGDIFLNSSLLEAARREFEEALKSDPNNVQAKSGLMKAEIYDRSDDQDPLVTKRRIEFLLKKNPKDKHALLNLGIIYTHVDSARAIRYLEQALEQDSSLVAAYLNLGYLYEQNGDHDKALIMNEKALEKAEWHRQALNNAGYHYVRRGDYGKAVECLTKLSKLDPSSMIVYWNLSNALRYLGEHEEAYLQLRRVSKMMNDDSICDDATNSSDWFFDTATDGSDSGALFEDLQQKRLYSKYSLALSACLTGRESEAEQALDDASGMECDLREPAVKFLSANIAKLRSVDENLTEPLNAFCGKLMERIDGASFKRFLLLFRQF